MELVTPANNLDMLLASLAQGSDAVYVPLNGYLAIRLGRDFFTPDDLEHLVTQVHDQGKAIYPVVNGGIREGEQQRYYDIAQRILASGADGAVVGSIALIDWFKQHRTTTAFKIIASSTLGVINPDDARFFASRGADRVILSRMHALDELVAFTEIPHLETELFVHGVVCPCWEGIPCLIPQVAHKEQYDGVTCLAKNSDQKSPPCQDAGWWKLQMQCDFSHLPKFLRLGIDSIKVIPVATSPEGSAQIVRLWRQALDAAKQGNSFDWQDAVSRIRPDSPLPLAFDLRTP